jgi:hypothetical protein
MRDLSDDGWLKNISYVHQLELPKFTAEQLLPVQADGPFHRSTK